MMISNIGIISQSEETIVPEASKTSLHFDSTYNEWVQLPLNFVTGTRTISFRVKPDVTTFNGQARQFLAAQYAGSGQRTFYAEFRDTGVIRCYFSTHLNGNNYALIESNAGQYFNAGQEYYITFTIDSSTGTKLYVDGVLQTDTDSNTLQLSRNGSFFHIGGFGPYIANLSSDAKIKDVNVWTVSRSQSDVLADMTRTWTGFESGLKAYFAFDEENGSTVEDITGTYSGTITTTNTTPNYIDDVMWVDWIEPVQTNLLVYYNIDDVNSYNFASVKTTLTNVASSGGYGGTIDLTGGTYPQDVDDFPTTLCGYGSDSNGKFLYMTQSTNLPQIKINQTVSLTNWSAQFKVKNRGEGNYPRFLGTRNYRMELVYRNGNIWYYQSGWVNTGVSYPNDGNYHIITFTYQNSPKEFKIYVDGVLEYTITTKGTTLVSSSYFWIFGSQDRRQEKSYFNKFLLYSKTLTQSEININNNL